MSGEMSTAATNLLDPTRRDVGRSPEGPRVLIAEDDRDLRELLEEVFREDGWVVHTAPNGTKLLDELSQAILESKELVPDLVLTDIMMPGIHVMSVLGELRAAGWTTPVIVVSARADEIQHEIGRALDPIVFCQKPVDLDRLLRIAHAERRQRAPQAPMYRGAHPSTDEAIDAQSRPNSKR
jgi:DNA-binding response OmpR family regulator